MSVLRKLQFGLKEHYYYHSVEHTEVVITAAKLLADLEGLSEEKSQIVQTAGLMHDLGLINIYEGHEDESARLSKEILPLFGYNESQIELICRLIVATKMPQTPDDLLEMIICDADMFYLGEESYVERSGFLREEMRHFGKEYSDKEWYAFQKGFLMNHHFFTASASSLLDKGKEKNLVRVKELLQECI